MLSRLILLLVLEKTVFSSLHFRLCQKELVLKADQVVRKPWFCYKMFITSSFFVGYSTHITDAYIYHNLKVFKTARGWRFEFYAVVAE